jgi:hypothetical protein
MRRPRLRLGLVLVLVFASGCSGLRSGGEGPAERTDNRLDGHGVSVRLPRAWDGRIAERGFPLPGATVVYAASFPLPARDDEPASKAQRAVRRGDVLVILSETLHNLSLPTTKPAIALNTRGVSVDQYFIANARAFALRATFGSKSPAKKLIRSVNALLASLTVERRNRPLTPAPDPVSASAKALPVSDPLSGAPAATLPRLAAKRPTSRAFRTTPAGTGHDVAVALGSALPETASRWPQHRLWGALGAGQRTRLAAAPMAQSPLLLSPLRGVSAGGRAATHPGRRPSCHARRASRPTKGRELVWPGLP